MVKFRKIEEFAYFDFIIQNEDSEGFTVTNEIEK
jgi:hypothetical protein